MWLFFSLYHPDSPQFPIGHWNSLKFRYHIGEFQICTNRPCLTKNHPPHPYTWRPNDPGIPTWRPPKSIDPSLIPGPRRWILILTSAKNTTNCGSAPLVGSANGQTNYIHPGKLTFPTQWWFGSDDWVSFRWSMVIFRGVKCLHQTWINARWRRNFLEPSPLPKHFLYPYSLLTCTPSLKELMYTPENKRLKPKQGPKRKRRQNIDPKHQFLASSRSFLFEAKRPRFSWDTRRKDVKPSPCLLVGEVWCRECPPPWVGKYPPRRMQLSKTKILKHF